MRLKLDDFLSRSPCCFLPQVIFYIGPEGVELVGWQVETQRADALYLKKS